MLRCIVLCYGSVCDAMVHCFVLRGGVMWCELRHAMFHDIVMCCVVLHCCVVCRGRLSRSVVCHDGVCCVVGWCVVLCHVLCRVEVGCCTMGDDVMCCVVL